MRVLGLDLGTKRIGIACSDALGWTAQVHSTLIHSSEAEDLAAIAKICAETEAERIVVGLPLNMDGTRGERAHAAEEFGARLEQELNLPVEYWDERLSTVSSERILIAADVSRKKRKAVVDRLAAAIILQSWLDRNQSNHGSDILR